MNSKGSVQSFRETRESKSWQCHSDPCQNVSVLSVREGLTLSPQSITATLSSSCMQKREHGTLFNVPYFAHDAFFKSLLKKTASLNLALFKSWVSNFGFELGLIFPLLTVQVLTFYPTLHFQSPRRILCEYNAGWLSALRLIRTDRGFLGI